jgi:hypothetical protein
VEGSKVVIALKVMKGCEPENLPVAERFRCKPYPLSKEKRVRGFQSRVNVCFLCIKRWSRNQRGHRGLTFQAGKRTAE